VTDDLSERPDFGPPDKMPWDESEADRALWIDGTPLGDFSSQTLLAHRRLLVKKQGAGNYFQDMIDAIDAVLTERGGE
jgi:hypothetical protein